MTTKTPARDPQPNAAEGHNLHMCTDLSGEENRKNCSEINNRVLRYGPTCAPLLGS